MSNTLIDQPVVQEAAQATDPAEQFERYDTIDTPKIVVVGFIAAILTFAVIVGVQAMFFAAASSEEERKAFDVTGNTMQRAINQQEARLANYEWVDPDKGVVNIPIERAMQQVVDDYRDKDGPS